MKKVLSVTVAFLALAMSAIPLPALPGNQDRDENQSARSRFIGAWRFVSLEAPGSDGKIQKADSTGLFVFTRDGHASVQVMERNPPPQTQAAPEQYSYGGYEATFGTYEVDESAHTFVFHVEGALVRTLIGKNLPRSFEFSGNQLIVKSTRPEEHWKVTWERY
ncbi:MAG TPA: lipocalin-like domain-containing protein [Candidatus Acidoferrum sp.]